jgi:hypothetical protein
MFQYHWSALISNMELEHIGHNVCSNIQWILSWVPVTCQDAQILLWSNHGDMYKCNIIMFDTKWNVLAYEYNWKDMKYCMPTYILTTSTELFDEVSFCPGQLSQLWNRVFRRWTSSSHCPLYKLTCVSWAKHLHIDVSKYYNCFSYYLLPGT